MSPIGEFLFASIASCPFPGPRDVAHVSSSKLLLVAAGLRPEPTIARPPQVRHPRHGREEPRWPLPEGPQGDERVNALPAIELASFRAQFDGFFVGDERVNRLFF